MAITSADINTEMLEAAKATYGVRTNREAINLALEDAVMRQRQLDAIAAIAALDLEVEPAKITYDA